MKSLIKITLSIGLILIIIFVSRFIYVNLQKPVCAKEGEKINHNPLIGPTNQFCCEGLEEIRVSKSYSICQTKEICKNLCGDGICQEIVCMAIGCPCPETKETCPADCK